MATRKPRRDVDGSMVIVLPEKERRGEPEWRSVNGVVTAVVAGPVDAGWIDRCVARVDQSIRDGAGGTVVLLPRGAERRNTWTRRLVKAAVDDVIPLDDPESGGVVRRALERLRQRLERADQLAANGLIGTSRLMRRTRKTLAAALGDPDIPVLLLGETGTGKALAARAMHRADPERSTRPFHAVDGGTVVDTLFGSELFGHVRGAFTGAQTSRLGAFATAGTGTLLLDEVGELSGALQAALLTALQERRYRPVGSDRECKVECRVVTATNRDLPALVTQRRFRPDLFYRLDGVRVVLPPLRSRREDIPVLFAALVRRVRPRALAPEIDEQLIAELQAMPLPGNVRQLETIARHCVHAAGPGERIRLAHLPAALFTPSTTAPDDAETISGMVDAGMSLDTILHDCEARAIRAALDIAGRAEPNGRKTAKLNRAARLLKISKRTLYKRLQGDGTDTTPQ